MQSKTSIVVLLCFLSIVSSTWAKRGGAPLVEPVMYENIKYRAPNDDGFREYIQAWDMSTNGKIWELTIFENPRDGREKDVQWKFIEKLEINNGNLLITDECARQFVVDLKTKQITRLK